MGVLETATKPDGSLYYGFPLQEEKVKEILKEQFNKEESTDTHREREAFVVGTRINSVNVLYFIVSEIKKNEGYFRLEGNQKIFLRRAKKLLKIMRDSKKDDVAIYNYLGLMIRKTRGTSLNIIERVLEILNLGRVTSWLQESSPESERKPVDSW
jgi:hypothetical protein